MVRTVALEPDPGDAPSPHIATAAVAAAAPGDVVVVANDGRTDVSCWGGLLSLGSVRRGIAGVIADGACRDVAEAEEYGFPVFARGTTPRTARGRLRQRAVGGTVTVAGVEVEEGDLVVADGSGVAFVPRARAEQVLERAEQILAREAAVAADLRAGAAVDRAVHDARLAGTASPGRPGEAARRAPRPPGAPPRRSSRPCPPRRSPTPWTGSPCPGPCTGSGRCAPACGRAARPTPSSTGCAGTWRPSWRPAIRCGAPGASCAPARTGSGSPPCSSR
ncbi:hypothetical protein GCM10011374_18770 [Kocuria dechangensis]|uniref:Putative 4-hydroxy-4-methyl-2-oxoglutarate aldolase n=1 Tax=Kocuria dechangensis TaxID=1176249 RepID=A0A917LUH4_9MICC|nr:hypothetical protein GCM10011374_18770 [Kocuria dechangensis]